MKLGDIYVNKKTNNIIQIDSFAHRMNDMKSEFIIVFTNIEKHNEFEVGSCPSFNGYGSQEEIEQEYSLLVPNTEIYKYKTWNEIFELIDK